jgi:septal ring factor EnvC (AmiA/AmiB activator)
MFGGGESPRSKARREMYGLGSSVPVAKESVKGKEPAVAQVEDEDYDLEDDDEYLKGLQANVSKLHFIIADIQQSVKPTSQNVQSAESTDPSLTAALAKTSTSLAKTLDRIANSLDKHTADSREEGRYFVDVKLHTEAIKDVMNVLGMVKSYKP